MTCCTYVCIYIIYLQIFCLGALIASAVALTAIKDIIIFDDDIGGTEDQDHKSRYEEVAWWIIGVGIASVVLQGIMAILYLDGIFVNSHIRLGVIVSPISAHIESTKYYITGYCIINLVDILTLTIYNCDLA